MPTDIKNTPGAAARRLLLRLHLLNKRYLRRPLFLLLLASLPLCALLLRALPSETEGMVTAAVVIVQAEGENIESNSVDLIFGSYEDISNPVDATAVGGADAAGVGRSDAMSASAFLDTLTAEPGVVHYVRYADEAAARAALISGDVDMVFIFPENLGELFRQHLAANGVSSSSGILSTLGSLFGSSKSETSLTIRTLVRDDLVLQKLVREQLYSRLFFELDQVMLAEYLDDTDDFSGLSHGSKDSQVNKANENSTNSKDSGNSKNSKNSKNSNGSENSKNSDDSNGSTDSENSDERAAFIREHMTALRRPDSFFTLAYADGRTITDSETAQLLTAPLRGLLAVLLLLIAFAAALTSRDDLAAGRFLFAPPRRRALICRPGTLLPVSSKAPAVPSRALICRPGTPLPVSSKAPAVPSRALICQLSTLLPVFDAALVAFVTLRLSAPGIPAARELLLLALYLAAATGFASLLVTLTGGGHLCVCLIPVLTIACLVLCPVFVSLTLPGVPAFLLPPWLYLRALHSDIALAGLALYALLANTLNLLLAARREA